MFCLAPTIRFGGIYFADHYNYIYYSYFLYLSAQRDKLGKLSGYASVCETATIHHMSDLESDPEEVFFRTLPWRRDDLNELIHQCDASMSLIKTYGAVSARPKPPEHN